MKDLTMTIRIPKDLEADFRIFVVTHGGAIETCQEAKTEEACDCISRKEATDRFDLVQSDDKCMSYDDIMAFLSSLPPVEPEKCEDCISRQAAIEAVTHFDDTLKRIYELPSVHPEREVGRWIPVNPQKGGKWLPAPKGNTIIISDEMADISLRLPTALCSNCGEVVPVIGKWKKYCSMCGEKMEDEAESEDKE